MIVVSFYTRSTPAVLCVLLYCAPCLHAAMCSKGSLTAAGVVHCSVNPDNVALVVHEGQMCVKLTGFETSQPCERMECLSRLIPSTSYTAPEVCTGYYTAAADLWSLGGVVYWLLSGDAPSGLGELRCYRTSSMVKPVFSYDSSGCIITGVGIVYCLNCNPATYFRHPVTSAELGHGTRFPPGRWDTISAQPKSFLRQLLISTPHLRSTAAQMLQHPWLQPLGQAGMVVESLQH